MTTAKLLPGRSWNQNHLQRCAQGLLSVLLSLKRRAAVRYEAASEPCARLAERVRDLLRREAVLIDNNIPLNGELPTPQLLIIDRRDDPVTPLLSQVSAAGFTSAGVTHTPTLSCNNSGVLKLFIFLVIVLYNLINEYNF